MSARYTVEIRNAAGPFLYSITAAVFSLCCIGFCLALCLSNTPIDENRRSKLTNLTFCLFFGIVFAWLFWISLFVCTDLRDFGKRKVQFPYASNPKHLMTLPRRFPVVEKYRITVVGYYPGTLDMIICALAILSPFLLHFYYDSRVILFLKVSLVKNFGLICYFLKQWAMLFQGRELIYTKLTLGYMVACILNFQIATVLLKSYATATEIYILERGYSSDLPDVLQLPLAMFRHFKMNEKSRCIRLTLLTLAIVSSIHVVFILLVSLVLFLIAIFASIFFFVFYPILLFNCVAILGIVYCFVSVTLRKMNPFSSLIAKFPPPSQNDCYALRSVCMEVRYCPLEVAQIIEEYSDYPKTLWESRQLEIENVVGCHVDVHDMNILNDLREMDNETSHVAGIGLVFWILAMVEFISAWLFCWTADGGWVASIGAMYQFCQFGFIMFRFETVSDFLVCFLLFV